MQIKYKWIEYCFENKKKLDKALKILFFLTLYNFNAMQIFQEVLFASSFDRTKVQWKETPEMPRSSAYSDKKSK